MNRHSIYELLHHSRQVLFELDAHFCWLSLSSAWEELTGFSITESLGRSIFDPIDTSEHAALRHFLSSENTQRTSSLFHFSTRDRHVHLMELIRVDASLEAPSLIRGILRESVPAWSLQQGLGELNTSTATHMASPTPLATTESAEHRIALEALRETGAHFRLMLEQMPAVLWTTDVDLRFSLSAGAGLELLNMRPNQTNGRSLYDYFATSDSDFLPILMHRRALAGSSVSYEFEWLERIWSAHIEPFYDSHGLIIGTIGVALDITTRIRAEEEVRRLNLDLERRVADRTAQLESALKELEVFSYSVSHDLRAPLRAIDGFSQAVIEDYGSLLPPEGRHFLDRLRQASRQMDALIRDLLKLSRVSSSELNHEAIDLSEEAQNILQELRVADPERHVETIVQPSLSATGDRRLIKLALENLLDNAWKFTQRQPNARIEFGKLERDGVPLFYVRDNGTGFRMEHAHRLFQPFHRLHTVDEFAGIGLGLAIVDRILRRHHGKIFAESVEGHGTTFFFRLE